MIKKRHKKHNESGRSMIEMLGVLALLILLTLGGIKVFGLLYANVVSKAVTDSVMTEASIRRHEHMKRMPDGPNIEETPGPYGYKLHVEDGTTGDLANTFWVSLSLVESFYRKPICDSLLSRAGAFLQAQTEYQERNDSEHWLGMIEFVVDGKIVQECSDQVEEARYLFAKSGTNIGDINICFGTCCQLCPEGGVCRDGEITCEPGYKKVAGGPCGGGTCVKCTGRECCGPSCTDPECPPGTKPTDNNDACPCCTVGDDGEECGCPEGLRPNRECGCGCNDDEDCPEGEHCDTETGICSCTKKSCGDGERWNEKLCKCQSCGGGGCPCEEDSDCPRGWKCPDTEPKVCQPTECEKDEDCKFGMICDPIY